MDTRYPRRFIGLVCALHKNFTRRCHQARKVENYYFDLTCDIISDIQVNFFTLFGKFTYCAIEWRLKFGNRSSSLGDLRGALCPLPPAGRVTNQTPAGRGLIKKWKCRTKRSCSNGTSGLQLTTPPGADPGFLPGEGAKGLMTLYGMGMSDFWHTQTHICNFSRCLLSYYAWMVLNNHSRDTSVPSFCPWDEWTRAFVAGPSVPGVGAGRSAPSGSAPDHIPTLVH